MVVCYVCRCVLCVLILCFVCWCVLLCVLVCVYAGVSVFASMLYCTPRAAESEKLMGVRQQVKEVS